MGDKHLPTLRRAWLTFTFTDSSGYELRIPAVCTNCVAAVELYQYHYLRHFVSYCFYHCLSVGLVCLFRNSIA